MLAKILPFTPENLNILAEALKNDQVVGMPTETVYGLAGNCRSPKALARIFETKERPTFDPLIVHIAPITGGIAELEKLRLVDLSKISQSVQKRVNLLIEKFWPGPLTLVLPKHVDIPDLASSGLPSVGIRMPQHPMAQALIQAAQTPLAAPSANRFGRISPTTAQAVAEELGDRIEWILDGGDSQIGLESTVLGFDEPGSESASVQILRHGGVPQEKIEELLGEPILALPPSSGAPVTAPGMLESHYAPAKPLILLPRVLAELESEDFEPYRGVLDALPKGAPVGLLLVSGSAQEGAARLQKLIGRTVHAKSLSEKGDLTEAAHQLFAEMRAMDASPACLILSEPCLIYTGLGHAIADRLKRASARSAIRPV